MFPQGVVANIGAVCSAFKDVALQFLGNIFEFFLVRNNEGKTGPDREHLTVVGATSGDTGSAAIYGLRGKKDVSIFILYPTGKVSPVQEMQMTTIEEENGESSGNLDPRIVLLMGFAMNESQRSICR